MNEQNAMKPYVIGLDLGGTNSVFGIVDARGEIKATTAIKTKAYDNEEDYVNASIDALHIIIDQVGGLSDGLQCLYRQIREKKGKPAAQ